MIIQIYIIYLISLNSNLGNYFDDFKEKVLFLCDFFFLLSGRFFLDAVRFCVYFFKYVFKKNISNWPVYINVLFSQGPVKNWNISNWPVYSNVLFSRSPVQNWTHPRINEIITKTNTIKIIAYLMHLRISDMCKDTCTRIVLPLQE